jgi:hypothetical protein
LRISSILTINLHNRLQWQPKNIDFLSVLLLSTEGNKHSAKK